MIEIRPPKTKEEFKDYYNLRYELLRKPWNQPRGSEKDNLEKEAFHMAAFDNRKLIGVGRLHKNSNEEGQIRCMAVNEKYQNKGIGKAIINKLHDQAKKLKLKRMILHARDIAVGFYKKCGYKVTGKAPTLFGVIPHFNMVYKLT